MSHGSSQDITMTVDKSKARPAVGCADLLDACKELTRALNFYDRVQASSEDERIAVGRDHYDWVFRAARTVSSESNASLTLAGKEDA
jgi:hypothetical protein